jgi:hypothetical protein
MANPNQPNLGQTKQDLRDIAAMTEDTFRSVADNIQSMFKDALEQGQNVSKSLGNDISNNLKALARQSADSLNNQEKLNRGVLKQSDIQKQIEARMSKINAIENQITAAKMAGLDVSQDILEDLEATTRLNNVYINQLIDQKNLLDDIDKEVGQLGLGIKGLGTFVSKLGFDGLAKPLENGINNAKAYKAQLILAEREYQALINTSEELTDDEKERKQLLESEIKSLEKKQGRLKNIAASLKEEITLRNMTDALIGKVVASFFKLDEAQSKFQNLTGGQIPIMDQFNGRLVTSIDYIQTAASLTEKTGMNASAIFTPDTLASAAEMVKAMGMTQEQANKAATMSQVNGQSIDKMNASIKQGTKEHNATNRSALAQGVIMRDVYSTSTSLAASLGNSTKRITEAATSARDLGLNLAEVEGIANSLLNIESSIASEFEYEVISGKQLNLEAARYYALTNQTEKLTAEIAKNQEIVQSFASGNRIEQEAAAKALGLNRDQLAEMYMAQQRQAGLTDAQIAKNMKMEEGEVRRLSAQESINTAISKMTELLAGPAQMLSAMIDSSWILYGVMTAIGGVIMTQMVLGVIEMGKGLILAIPKLAIILGLESGIAAAKISGAMAATVGLGAIAILGGIAVGVGALMSSVKGAKSAGDINSPADGKTQISTKEGGLFELSKNDDVVAFPGASKAFGRSNAPQSQAIDYDKMAQAMSRVQVQTNIDGVNASRLFQTPMGIATRKL